ncbi:MAG: VWA domain-containing protein, partial [Nitrospirae bacterium]|nr:VWA domain-containing protein [Nitrospirota bacterium]
LRWLIWRAPLAFLAFWLGARRRGNAVAPFASETMIARITRGFDGKRRKLSAVLVCLSLLFLSIALSGPLYGFKWREVERKGVDIIVALDCSRSMLAEDIKPNRLARAKRKVIDLLNRLEGDRIGLVAFAGTAFLQCPLTLDYAGMNVFLQSLSPDYLPVGGTAIAEAVDAAIDGFDPKSPAERAVILITDGEPTGGEFAGGDLVEAAERAKKAGIRLFIVGVGSAEGAPIPLPGGGFRKDDSGNIVLARLNEDALKQMAALTGGAYARSVSGDMDWDVIYNKGIRGGMEARKLESGKLRVWEDRFQWALFPAMLALLIEMTIPVLRRRRFPFIALMAFIPLAISPDAALAGAGGDVRAGIERYNAGDYKPALESFLKAQTDAPETPEAAFDVGDAQYKNGDYEGAMKSWSAAARGAKDDLKARAVYNMGNAAYRLDKLENAVKHYEEALKIKKDDEDARRNLEFVKRKIEQKKEEQKQHDRQDKQDGQDKKQDEQKQDKNEGKKDEKQQTAGKKGEKQQTGQQAGQKNDAGRKAAENMLNRLHDKPGTAMVPAYRKRSVEKDW